MVVVRIKGRRYGPPPPVTVVPRLRDGDSAPGAAGIAPTHPDTKKASKNGHN